MSVPKLPIPTVYCAPLFRTNVAGEKPDAAICPVELRSSVYIPKRLPPVISCADTVSLYVLACVVADAVFDGGEVSPPAYTAETRYV